MNDKDEFGFDAIETKTEYADYVEPEITEVSIAEKKPSRGNYVDKKLLYEAYVEWYAAIDDAKAKGLTERPDPPKYISTSIIAICENLATRWNFSGYAFRDEMIGDAIENLYRYADRVNLEKYQNVYGYMTNNAWWAFVRRIKDEKAKAAVKYQMLMNSGVLENLNVSDFDDAAEYNSIVEQFQYAADSNLANVLPVKKKKIPREKRSRIRKDVVSVEDFLGE